MAGYLPDDFRGEDGGPKARTEASDGKVHYRSRDPEAYLNFALHNGFSNEYPTELPENLLL